MKKFKTVIVIDDPLDAVNAVKAKGYLTEALKKRLSETTSPRKAYPGFRIRESALKKPGQ